MAVYKRSCVVLFFQIEMPFLHTFNGIIVQNVGFQKFETIFQNRSQKNFTVQQELLRWRVTKLLIFMNFASSCIFLAKGIRADRVAACSLLAY